MYPYCPAHIARPKEVKRLLLIALPERCYLSVSFTSAVGFFVSSQPLQLARCHTDLLPTPIAVYAVAAQALPLAGRLYPVLPGC